MTFEIVATVRDGIGRLDQLFSSMLSRPFIDLVEALARLAPQLTILVISKRHRRRTGRIKARSARSPWSALRCHQSGARMRTVEPVEQL